MVRILCTLVALVLTISSVLADVYMHNPRGSNNRLNEKSAARTNGDRCFDSQNNARGGYNVGDVDDNKARNEAAQHRARYYMSGNPNAAGGAGDSYMTIEWTNQHGCGGQDDTDPHKMNCNMVIQYMCQDDNNNAAPDDSITIRNGQSTNTQAFTASDNDNDSEGTVENRRNNNVRADRCLQESWEWYDDCNRRERNKGLFTADQDPNDEAVNTRQNPNGNRRGYECPEERDYYPYWHPTPWMDIAVLAHNESMCSTYKADSFNSKKYGRCVETFGNGNKPKHWSTANNPAACQEKGGTWTEFESYLELAPQYTTRTQCLAQSTANIKYKWGKPYDPKKIVNHDPITDACMVELPEVDCKASDWSRVNHLGNGRDPVTLNYTWTLPYFPSENKKRCVLRLRYNISTDDYDPFGTFADSNKVEEDGVVTRRSPIEQNPLVDVGLDGNQLLQLAINTAQTGRTFQDRSHAFWMVARTDTVGGHCDDEDDAECKFDPLPNNANIYNLMVRGKRGNIVQTFPAVEYDFTPTKLEIGVNDLIALQWTGSNSHNNGNPAGDGQSGSAGEGTAGTDRNNVCETKDASTNFCVPFEENTLFQCMKVHWSTYGLYGNNDEMRNVSIALQMMSSGYFHCYEGCDDKPGRGRTMNDQLNNAPASTHGWVFSLQCSGRTFYYISTRNNNFTNRSQKAKITVT